jgi:nitroreductase
MQVLEAIAQRRSIRKFKDEPVSEDILRKILHAATLAPSGKNRQPWRFIVVQGEKRAEMLRVMRQSIEKRKEEGVNTGSSEWTIRVMEQAPVTIFIFDDSEDNVVRERAFLDFLWNVVNLQSIGAAIQNMLLAALDYGLGTLWICDVFYAYGELCDWLGEEHLMVAAVSVGYPDEQPKARPRQAVDEVTRWL